MSAGPVVTVEGISKTFPGQRALVDVDLAIERREIHALLGQNGSGKSTLIKVLAGVYHPDPGGRVLVDGHPLPPGSPRDSHRMGLRFVHQALGIIEELTAVENVALGFGYRRRAGRLIDWRSQRRKTRALLGRLDVEIDIDCPVSELRPVDRSAVAIARALDADEGNPRLLVLDEPTAALPPSEVEHLFALVRQARDAGTSIVYVSHRLDEVLALTDRASVLRDGVLEGTGTVAELGRAGLVAMILGTGSRGTGEPEGGAADGGPAPPPAGPGRSPGSAPGHAPAAAGTPVLTVRGLTGVRLDGVDLDVAAGEVVGVAGLTGSGREELATAVVGASPSTGRVSMGRRGAMARPTPRRARELGVVLVLPNRAAGAATRELTVRENLVLPAQARYSRRGFVRRRRELADTDRWMEVLDVRPRDPERAYALLSGGNQQKVVFGKWLNLDPDVLVLDDPTSGVDIGARQVIYDLVRRGAAEGKCFVVCSSDTEDLVAVCDRVLVLRGGRWATELVGPEVTDANLAMALVAAERDEAVGGAGAGGAAA